jgi:sugar phosphate permease
MGLTWIEIVVIAHLVLYLTETLVFGVVAAGGLLAMTEAAGAIARPRSGLLSARVFDGNRRRVCILMAGTAAFMCFIVGLFGAGFSWGFYPVLFMLGGRV